MSKLENYMPQAGIPGEFRKERTIESICSCGCGQVTSVFESTGEWCGPQTAALRWIARDPALYGLTLMQFYMDKQKLQTAEVNGLSPEELVGVMLTLAAVENPVMAVPYFEGMERPFDCEFLPIVAEQFLPFNMSAN